MNKAQRNIRRKTRVLEHAARIGSVRKTCRYFASRGQGSTSGRRRMRPMVTRAWSTRSRARSALAPCSTVNG